MSKDNVTMGTIVHNVICNLVCKDCSEHKEQPKSYKKVTEIHGYIDVDFDHEYIVSTNDLNNMSLDDLLPDKASVGGLSKGTKGKFIFTVEFIPDSE